VMRCQPPPDEVRSDKSGAACDDDLHFSRKVNSISVT
jgi:hypothetical protein